MGELIVRIVIDAAAIAFLELYGQCGNRLPITGFLYSELCPIIGAVCDALRCVERLCVKFSLWPFFFRQAAIG